MPSICAWCRAPLREWADDLDRVSHGICEPCLVALEYHPQPLAAFLESLPGAVMALNSDVRVVAGNDRLLAVVGKEQSAALDRLGGEVISCIYAELPGGCGQTVHCVGCSIRTAVTETRETRQPKTRVPAFSYVRTTDGGVAKLRLHISTECAGSLILLRVDEAEAVA
jgi:hypothetical protein